MQTISGNPKRARPLPPYDPAADVIRPRHLKAATGLSSTTIWRLRQRGEFPQPIRLSSGACGWFRGDLAEWLASRGRTNESAPTRTTGARR
jgi:prophage regulatory protein